MVDLFKHVGRVQEGDTYDEAMVKGLEGKRKQDSCCFQVIHGDGSRRENF